MGTEFNDDEEQVVEKKRWALFGLPFTFTKYIVKRDILTIESGCFTKKEDDCYMYKIQDTHPKLYLHNIKNSKETKDFILKYSEEARLKRRTLNTLNIGAHDVEDIAEDC